MQNNCVCVVIIMKMHIKDFGFLMMACSEKQDTNIAKHDTKSTTYDSKTTKQDNNHNV